jgi:guanylate kinase
MNPEAKLLIITAPSGSGKTTIVRHLLQRFPALRFSVSATNRSRRPMEINGRDYYFISDARFRELIAEDAFLEWEEVYPGAFYGTLRSEVDRLLEAGHPVVFDIDVKGALRLKEQFGPQALAVFIRPPSLDILIQRLRDRQTEDDASLERRIRRVTEEMGYEPLFDQTLVNDRLALALTEAETLCGSFLGLPSQAQPEA